MKKSIILVSTTVAGFVSCGLAEKGQFLPAILIMIYPLFVLAANTVLKKMPRAATQGREKVETKLLNFYSTTVTFGTQTKMRTPAGKMLMPVNYEE